MDDPETVEIWHEFLTRGERWYTRLRHIFVALPASPRCKLCQSPFRGPGGFVLRFTGKAPSRMNPRFCNACFGYLEKHPGGAEVPLTMLFADIRGSTTLAEKLGTKHFSALIARFYNVLTEELIHTDALIDRLIGDEVIALYLPGIAGEKHAQLAVTAAQRILRGTGHESSEGPWVPVGIGIHTGMAFVGAVGKSGVSDITALGDDVNLTARLASIAQVGEILITEQTRAAAQLPTEQLESRSLLLKGRSAPVDVWLMRIGVPAPS